MNMSLCLLRVLGALLLAQFTVIVSARAADNYPNRNITLLVGYAAGGATDLCARILAHSAEKELHTTVVVENRPGAGSSIAIGRLVKARADGYTIATLSTGGLINQFLRSDVGYDINKDTTPILMFGRYQAGLVVRPDSPWKTIKDVIAAAKEKPNTLTFGMAGVGTQQHLTMIELGQMARVTWVPVPYNSGPEAIYALLRGDVDMIAQTAEWAPFVRSGQLRLISVFSDKRIEEFSSVPTLQEEGYDISSPSLLGLVGPAGMKEPVVSELAGAFHKAMGLPKFKSCMNKFGLEIDYLNGADFGSYLRQVSDKWGPLIRSIARK